jgi:hypothetical protein
MEASLIHLIETQNKTARVQSKNLTKMLFRQRRRNECKFHGEQFEFK